MKYLLLFLIAAFIYRLLTNFCNLRRLAHYEEIYLQYLSKGSEVNILESKTAILQLFTAAGVADSLISYATPTGYGMLATGSASAFQNISSCRQDVVAAIARSFAEARGTFKHRIFETLSPLFWINCVLFLPQRIFNFLGIKDDSLLIKLLQLLYWICTPLLLVFRQDIYQYISTLIGQIQ